MRVVEDKEQSCSRSCELSKTKSKLFQDLRDVKDTEQSTSSVAFSGLNNSTIVTHFEMILLEKWAKYQDSPFLGQKTSNLRRFPLKSASPDGKNLKEPKKDVP